MPNIIFLFQRFPANHQGQGELGPEEGAGGQGDGLREGRGDPGQG